MRLWNNLKIRPKLLLVYTLGAVIPILVVATYLIFRLYAVSFENSMQASLASLVQLRVNYANYLETCADTTRRIARDAQLISYVGTRYASDFDAIMDFFTPFSPLSLFFTIAQIFAPNPKEFTYFFASSFFVKMRCIIVCIHVLR